MKTKSTPIAFAITNKKNSVVKKQLLFSLLGAIFICYAININAQNTKFGQDALANLTTGNGNSAFGYQSLNHNTFANSNAAFGHRSLYSNISGSSNTANGSFTLTNNQSGNYNTAIGYGSLYLN